VNPRNGKMIYGSGSILLAMLAGIVIGGFLGQALGGFSFLEWLGYGKEFGLQPPLAVDLNIVKFTFGLVFNINIGGVIGIIVALIGYRLLSRR